MSVNISIWSTKLPRSACIVNYRDPLISFFAALCFKKIINIIATTALWRNGFKTNINISSLPYLYTYIQYNININWD